MRPQTNGRIVRIKKLSRSAGQQILREDQIDSTEYESLQGQYKVETGVEKSEESEYHLQAALAATSGAGEKEGEIPAPPAEESPDIDYDSLYSLVFDKPATYIRFSQTVEECTGCQYDMTTEDDAFLKEYNQKRPSSAKCSEDDFEKIMAIFEDTADRQAPFAAVDNTVIPFEPMNLALKQYVEEKLGAFAKDIYDFWKVRRQNSGNKALQPSLKFETHQDNDDGDPYVCFRRREVRQTRKTRARDVQSTDKLRRLRKELEDGRNLVSLAHRREATKRKLLEVDRHIFDQRAKVKDGKIKLNIRTTDDDDLLINQKPQKRKPDNSQSQRPYTGPLRFPGRPERPLEADLILLSDLMGRKEIALQQEIEEKTKQHRKWNASYVDLTREPLSPVQGQGPEAGFRPATTQYQYLMTPPSSVTSESFDQSSPTQEKSDPFTFRYSSPPEEDDSYGQPAYRRRIGRCGRLWIDRRGMPSIPRCVEGINLDRWKYDQDDDNEQPVYEVDPYDTKALRFRATIPIPSHQPPQRNRPDDRLVPLRVSGISPTNSRIITTQTQPQLPT